MKVYFISGLGADCRIFSRIRLPEGFEKVDLNWITPYKKESLSDYAMRLSQGINKNEKFALVGLSLGGMIVTEIASKYHPAATFLVSSVSSSNQIPRLYKFMNVLKIHALLPVSVIKSVSVLKRFFTAESKEDKALLRKIIRDVDPDFLRWGLNAIPTWNHTSGVIDICHIHGGGDAILPVRRTRPTHIIPGGTHMIILNNAEEINRIIAEKLTSLQND